MLLSPAHQILQLSKAVGMEGKVHVVTCGGGGHMTEVQHAMHDSLTMGYWLVINNAHLAQPWTQEMLELLKVSDRELAFSVPHIWLNLWYISVVLSSISSLAVDSCWERYDPCLMALSLSSSLSLSVSLSLQSCSLVLFIKSPT